MFEADPTSKGTDYQQLGSSRSEWQDLEPYHRWKTSEADVDPINPGSQRTLDIFAGLSDLVGCSGKYGDPFAQPYCYYDKRRDDYLPAPSNDYVAGVFAFNTTDDALGAQTGLLGYADDNWVDGTQSYVFEFDSPALRDAGLRVHHDDDPRGGPPPRAVAPARRLRPRQRSRLRRGR